MAADMSSPPSIPRTTGHHGGLFPELRLTKGVRNATDAELVTSVESCEGAALWGAVAVVAGLVAEVVLAVHQTLTPIAWDSPTGTWGAVIADSLVALGVSAEVFFSKLGMNRQRELQRRSDAKLGEAIERAAKAELEIARIKARRSLNQREFVEALRGKPAWPVVEILYVDGSDCSGLAIEIAIALDQSGWRCATPQPLRGFNPGCEFPYRFVSDVMSWGAQTTGVTVVATEVSLDEPHPFSALQRALMEGLSTKEAKGGRDPSMRPATLRVVVAPRQ